MYIHLKVNIHCTAKGIIIYQLKPFLPHSYHEVLRNTVGLCTTIILVLIIKRLAVDSFGVCS